MGISQKTEIWKSASARLWAPGEQRLSKGRRTRGRCPLTSLDVYSTGKSIYNGCSMSRQTRRYWDTSKIPIKLERLSPVQTVLLDTAFALVSPFCDRPRTSCGNIPMWSPSPCFCMHIGGSFRKVDAFAIKTRRFFSLTTSSGCSGRMNSQPCPGQSSPGNWDGLGLMGQQVSP